MAETEVPEILANDIRYFSSTRNYTLALLNAFNGVELYVNQDESELDRVFTVNITFGNYEKSVVLEDITENAITTGNFNFLPRLVLSFEGLTKATDRQTNKFHKLHKKIYHPAFDHVMMNVAYNSVAYDFNYTLLLQARGLTQTSQLVEEILVYFKPTMNLNILECPIFNDKTETQILISDPAFEINQDFEESDVNIISVTFDLTLRGNIYSPIEMVAPIKVVKLFTHIWDERDYEASKLANYYRFDISQQTGKVIKQTERHFSGTTKFNKIVEQPQEVVIVERPDFDYYQIETCYPENVYNELLNQSYNPELYCTPYRENTLQPKPRKPILEIYGEQNINLEFGHRYIEPGYYAKDYIDGELPVTVIGTVIEDQTGIYNLIYQATNSQGLSSEKIRIVTVS